MGSSQEFRSTIAELVRTLGDERAEPDLDWVRDLTGRPLRSIEEATRGILRHEDVERKLREAHLAGGREFYAQICAPLELYAIVRLTRPLHVVETGVSSGVSSAHFLLGLSDNGTGTLHSIDLPLRQKDPVLGAGASPVSLPPGRSSGWAVPKEIVRGWELELGPSQELLPRLVERLPAIDMFLHDSLHTPHHLAFELSVLRPKLTAGSIVLADNVNWTGDSFDQFASSVGSKVFKRRDSELVGLRMPAPTSAEPSPDARAVPGRAPRPIVPTRRRKRSG